MAVKAGEVLASMLGAARQSLGQDWPKARDYAKGAFEGLARALVEVSKLAASGKVSQEQAKALIRIHRNTTTMVLLTIEGLGIIAVEHAVNAALKVVRDAVNAAAGVAVL